MIDIKDISGKTIFSVQVNKDTVIVEELMSSDYIQLSWNSDKGKSIPVSSFIEYDGEKYRLLEPYIPQMENEAKYVYTPRFHSRVMAWSKQIVPVYTYGTDGTTVKTREMDWEFTGSPSDAMFMVKQAIKNETGEDWSIQLSDSLPATISISSQSASIFSVLNSIANECDTEWWADKKTNTLYLSKCVKGDPITLEVGKQVGVPSVTENDEGYYTRFYAFGSTRNIEQESLEGGASVNKRLTLDPVKYPYGYKDIRPGLTQEEVFVKTLYYDDIYPSSTLTISDVRARLRYRVDNEGNRIRIGGTDEEPVYEQYAIWYFQIDGFTFDPDTIIEEKNLSVSFESGQLAGRDFELEYHEKSETVKDGNDVTPFEINAGDYEIIIDESTGSVIPGLSYIIPQDGDSIILYNIVMPDEYTKSAQDKLEAELDKYIAKQEEDNRTYQTSSNPVYFYENKADLCLGQSVTFVCGEKSVSTRIQSIEKCLDLSCYQNFKLGNKIVKGVTQKLKEDVAYASQQIDIIKAFNELSVSLTNAYANAQREMIEGFATIKNLWQLKQDDEGNYYAYTEYDVLGKKGITAYSAGTAKVPSIFDGLPLDNVTIWKNPETGLIEVIGGTGGGSDFDATKMWAALSAATDEQINKSHLTTALSGYAIKSELNTSNWDTAYSWGNHANAGYAKQTALDAVSAKLNDFLEGSDTDTIINKWKELEAFLSGMAETDNLAEILETKADKSYVDSTFVTIATKQTITGEKTFSSVLNTAAIKASGEITTPSLAASDYVTIAGIKLRKLEDGALMLEGNLALTGALTMYASNGQSFDTIYDGLPIDNDTIYWQEVDGSRVLKAREGSGSSFDKSAMWAALEGATTEQINKTHLTTALNGYATESWVTSKNYLTSVSIATISDLHANWDALLKAAPSAYVTRWPTISEVTDKQNLVIKLNGGTTEGTNMFTYNATAAKSLNITASSVDAYTKSESDGRYPTKTGSGASGTWEINITGTAGAAHSADSAVKLQNVRKLWGNNFDGTTDVTGQINASNGIQLPYRGSIVTQFGNLLRTDYSEGNYNDFFELTARGSGSSENKLLGGNSGLLTWSGNRFIFNSYGVGWYVEDGEWMRTYNSLYVSKNVQCKGNIECDNKVICTTLQAKELDIAYGTNYKFVRMSWNGTSGDVASFFVPGSTSQWFTMELRSNGVLYINGDFLSGGGGTFYGSDIRYKSIMQQVNLSLLDIAKAPSFVYHWNKEGMKCDRLNLGGSAQYTQSILPWAVQDNNGFLNMDYAAVAYTFAVHTARHLLTYETRTDKKIKKLEREIVILKKRLKKLGYEEVRTLDDQSV